MIEFTLHALPYLGMLMVALIVGGLFSLALAWGLRHGRGGVVDDFGDELPRRTRPESSGYAEFFAGMTTQARATSGSVRLTIVPRDTANEIELWLSHQEADSFASQLLTAAHRAKAQKALS